MSKEKLKEMLDATINEDDAAAEVAFHSYATDKFRSIMEEMEVNKIENDRGQDEDSDDDFEDEARDEDHDEDDIDDEDHDEDDIDDEDHDEDDEDDFEDENFDAKKVAESVIAKTKTAKKK